MIKEGIARFIYYIFGNLIGRIVYSSEYFPKGKWFEHWYSIGWKWVLADGGDYYSGEIKELNGRVHHLLI